VQSAGREPGEQQPLDKIIVEAGRASASAEAPASAISTRFLAPPLSHLPFQSLDPSCFQQLT